MEMNEQFENIFRDSLAGYGDDPLDEIEKCERQLEEQQAENEKLKAELAAAQAARMPTGEPAPGPGLDVRIGVDGNFVDANGVTLGWEDVPRFDMGGGPLNESAAAVLRDRDANYARAQAEAEALDPEALLEGPVAL
jgi:hypothetical protein